MTRKSCLVLLSAVLGATLSASYGYAQVPKPAIAPPAVVPMAVDPLPGFPRPPDVPAGLLQDAPASPPYSGAPLTGPYFQPDPLLDPPPRLAPGWFMDIDIEAAVPHVKNHLSDSVVNGTGGTDTVSLDSSKLDWTVAPRFEVGYRLPAGFGEIAVAYRFVVSQGTETIIGPDAPAPQRSRLDLNVADLDYISREFFTEQWPYCHMKWRFGLRYADAYFDSTAVEPFDVAAAGSGNFEQRESNNYWGIGPHWGVELAREFGTSGVKLVGAVDGAILLGRLNQNFFEASTTLDANGQPLTGNTHEAKSQSVPMVNCFVGLSWQPTWSPTSQLSVGYQYEYWWNVGRDSDTTSRGELSDQGIVLRAEFKF